MAASLKGEHDLVSTCRKQLLPGGAFEDIRGECCGVDTPLRPVGEIVDQRLDRSAVLTSENEVADDRSLEFIGRRFDSVAHRPADLGQLITVEPTA